MLCRVIVVNIHKKGYEVDTTIIPILLTGKLKCGELKWLPKFTQQV